MEWLGRKVALINHRHVFLTLLFDVLIDVDASVDEILLRKHHGEDLLPVVDIGAMQVLRLDFLLCDDLNAIEHAQLRNVEEDLAAVVLFVLDGVEREVKLR